jgi:hypothetical protein
MIELGIDKKVSKLGIKMMYGRSLYH